VRYYSYRRFFLPLIAIVWLLFLQSLPHIRLLGLIGDFFGFRAKSELFKSADEAGISAVKFINAKSILINREFGGKICRQGDLYFYTAPLIGSERSTTVSRSGLCSLNSSIVGDYHTHGASPDNDRGGEMFSFPMKKGDRSNDISTNHYGYHLFWWIVPPHIGYLGTPSGNIMKYDPKTGNTYIFEFDRWVVFQRNLSGVLRL
jgi:Domain of unknown function (DUF4329)